MVADVVFVVVVGVGDDGFVVVVVSCVFVDHNLHFSKRSSCHAFEIQ